MTDFYIIGATLCLGFVIGYIWGSHHTQNKAWAQGFNDHLLLKHRFNENGLDYRCNAYIDDAGGMNIDVTPNDAP